MKNIILYTILFINISLVARENPFIPTKTYLEEKQILLEIKNKNIQTTEVNKEVNENQIISKKKSKLLQTITPLKNIKIEIFDTKVIINTQNNSVFRKLNLPKVNKIVLDYRDKTDFYTKREKLDHKYFQNISIGNHKKEGYFRIVVKLKMPIKNYNISYGYDINKDNNLVIISKKTTITSDSN